MELMHDSAMSVHATQQSSIRLADVASSPRQLQYRRVKVLYAGSLSPLAAFSEVSFYLF